MSVCSLFIHIESGKHAVGSVTARTHNLSSNWKFSGGSESSKRSWCGLTSNEDPHTIETYKQSHSTAVPSLSVLTFPLYSLILLFAPPCLWGRFLCTLVVLITQLVSRSQWCHCLWHEGRNKDQCCRPFKSRRDRHSAGCRHKTKANSQMHVTSLDILVIVTFGGFFPLWGGGVILIFKLSLNWGMETK